MMRARSLLVLVAVVVCVAGMASAHALSAAAAARPVAPVPTPVDGGASAADGNAGFPGVDGGYSGRPYPYYPDFGGMIGELMNALFGYSEPFPQFDDSQFSSFPPFWDPQQIQRAVAGDVVALRSLFGIISKAGLAASGSAAAKVLDEAVAAVNEAQSALDEGAAAREELNAKLQKLRAEHDAILALIEQAFKDALGDKFTPPDDGNNGGDAGGDDADGGDGGSGNGDNQPAPAPLPPTPTPAPVPPTPAPEPPTPAPVPPAPPGPSPSPPTDVSELSVRALKRPDLPILPIPNLPNLPNLPIPNLPNLPDLPIPKPPQDPTEPGFPEFPEFPDFPDFPPNPPPQIPIPDVGKFLPLLGYVRTLREEMAAKRSEAYEAFRQFEQGAAQRGRRVHKNLAAARKLAAQLEAALNA